MERQRPLRLAIPIKLTHTGGNCSKKTAHRFALGGTRLAIRA